MILIKSNSERRIDIPGVPEPVRRPVDIDQARTGFSNLRTLRIYRFDKESIIDGHAEEDEVFLVVLAGSIELTMLEAHPIEGAPTSVGPILLRAPETHGPCAAYLPPQAAYRLIARAEADVAYVRATTSGARSAAVFSSSATKIDAGVQLLLKENEWAQRLRLRLVRFDAAQHEIAFQPSGDHSAPHEGLLHIRTTPPLETATLADGSTPTIELESWDTIAIAPGDCLTLRFAQGSTGLMLLVEAH